MLNAHESKDNEKCCVIKKRLENLLLHTYKREAWIEFMLPEPIFDCVPYASTTIKFENSIHHSWAVNN